MYLPAHFAETRPEVLHALMREHPLATVVTMTAGGLTANHLPLRLHPGAGAQASDILRGHAARANPIWKDFTSGVEALVIFQGAQHYVSPNWYPSKQDSGKVVPTYNYCCVHVHGPLQVHDDIEWVRAMVTDLTLTHEAASPRPWAVSDAPEDYLRTMLGNIVGIEIPITRLTGKWKVSQNQPAANRAGVIEGLGALDEPEAAAMAELVRAHQRT